jgi:hypothetical protein
LAFIKTYGQERQIYGYLLDSATLVPVQYVEVRNEDTKAVTTSNEQGMFKIKADIGQTLIFKLISYTTKVIKYSNQFASVDTMHIIIVPTLTHNLENVVVSTYTYKQYQLDSAERRQEFLSDIGPKKRTLQNGSSGAGIGLNLDKMFNNDSKQRKRAIAQFDTNEEWQYTKLRYNSILVHGYTRLRGDSLQMFMKRFTPSYHWLRTHTDEDVKFFINDKLKIFYGRYSSDMKPGE